MILARPERFELPTPWFVARYSIQLSYGRVAGAHPIIGCAIGEAGPAWKSQAFPRVACVETEARRAGSRRPALWPALETLFGPRGACGGCWCMYWRLEKGERWDDLQGAPAKRRMKALVAAGKARGAIAFAGKEPVGWIAYGPRQDFPRLDRARTLACEDAGDVWSLPCFFIKAGWRDQGVAARAPRACAQVTAPAGREDRGGLSGEPEAGAATAERLRLDGHALAFRGCGVRARGSGDDLESADAAQALKQPSAFQLGSSSSTVLGRFLDGRRIKRDAPRSAARVPAGRSGRG